MQKQNPFAEVKAYDSYLSLLLLFACATLSAVAVSLVFILFLKKVMGVELGTLEPSVFTQGAAYILFCGLALKRLGVEPAASLRGWRENFFRDVLDALKYFGVYILLIAGLTGAAMLFRHFHPAAMAAAMNRVSPDTSMYTATARIKVSSPSRFSVLTFSMLVLTPVGEELFFRRFLYVTLRKRMRFAAALLISSALFSLAHLSAGPFVLPVALLLGWVYEKRRRLPVNIMLHALINVFVLYSRLG